MDFESWAPSFNEGGSVLDSTSRGIIWLRRIGYMKLMEGEGQKNHESGTEDGNRVDDKCHPYTMVPKIDTEEDKTSGEPKAEPDVGENTEDIPTAQEDSANEQEPDKKKNDSDQVTEENKKRSTEFEWKIFSNGHQKITLSRTKSRASKLVSKPI